MATATTATKLTRFTPAWYEAECLRLGITKEQQAYHSGLIRGWKIAHETLGYDLLGVRTA